MRCPVCMNFVNACSCEDGDWDRVVRKSFNDASRRKRITREEATAPDEKPPTPRSDGGW